MRLSRTDLLPLLTIVAGVVIGASLSFSFLGSRSDDVPGVTLGLLYESSTTKESARRLEDLQRLLESHDRTEEVGRLLERDRVERDRVEELQRVLERIERGQRLIVERPQDVTGEDQSDRRTEALARARELSRSVSR